LTLNAENATMANMAEYVGPIMAACRKRAGLSQEKLGEMLFCTHSVISKHENNHSMPAMNFMMAWAEATNSKDFLVAFIYGDRGGITLLINKLKIEGYWPEEITEQEQ
jgi:transcriptional regulator with XRE-family HTH domain